MDIEGKVALVTGAAKRVGRSIALAFAERGAELVVHYRTAEREAQEVLALAKKLGGNRWRSRRTSRYRQTSARWWRAPCGPSAGSTSW